MFKSVAGRITTLSLAGMLSLTAQSADAADLIYASDVERIASIAEGFGSVESIGKDDQGDPLIRGRMEGLRYGVYFYGCTNGADCQTIQFSVGVDLSEGLTLYAANEWNKKKRFAKVWLDEDGDPYLEMDVNTEKGVPEANLQETFAWWGAYLRDFKEYIDY